MCCVLCANTGTRMYPACSLHVSAGGCAPGFCCYACVSLFASLCTFLCIPPAHGTHIPIRAYSSTYSHTHSHTCSRVLSTLRLMCVHAGGCAPREGHTAHHKPATHTSIQVCLHPGVSVFMCVCVGVRWRPLSALTVCVWLCAYRLKLIYKGKVLKSDSDVRTLVTQTHTSKPVITLLPRGALPDQPWIRYV